MECSTSWTQARCSGPTTHERHERCSLSNVDMVHSTEFTEWCKWGGICSGPTALVAQCFKQANKCLKQESLLLIKSCYLCDTSKLQP